MRIWSLAKELAEATPAERNRYVDFLRAMSILAVVVGHWLIATAWYHDGEFTTGHLLKDRPETQWLTWLFQVMPVFFIVGGYSNAVSLKSAERKGASYAEWLIARLTRLAIPVVVLMLVWAGIALVMRLLDVDPAVIQYMSQASLIPTWFLAIYIMVAILAPLAWRFWQRAGYASFFAFAAMAVATDVLFFAFDLRYLGWSNYFWVWLAVHQLGFAWRENRLPSAPGLLAIAVAGFALLWLLIFKGPYPLAMVGSPDEGLSNTLPPKLTLLALGLLQFGVLMALEAPMRRALESLRLWTFTVLINSMIMTIYLWHITVMIVLGGLLYLAGGFGFGLEPGTGGWWLSRPLWIFILWALLLPLALVLSPLERRGRPKDAPVPGAVRQIAGAMAVCLGIALLALFGFGDEPADWVDVAAFVLAIGGSVIAGLLVLPRRKVPVGN
ncbi:MAG: acyltransferase [Pseudomonadota bacterium]